MSQSFQYNQYVPFVLLMRAAALILRILVGNTVFGDVELPLLEEFYTFIWFSEDLINNIILPRVARFVFIYVGEEMTEEEFLREIAHQFNRQLLLIIDHPTGDEFDDTDESG